MLRHAFATHEIAGGRDLSIVAEAMGHANTLMVSTTYQHAIAERKQASEPLRVEEAALAARAKAEADHREPSISARAVAIGPS